MKQPDVSFIGTVVVAVMGLCVLMERTAQKTPFFDEATGVYVLRYGLLMRIVGYMGAALALLFPALGFVFPPKNASDVCAMCAGFLFMGALSTVLLLEAIRVRITLNDEGVHAHSPWIRDRFIRWDEVRSVNYSPSNRWLILEDAKHQRIRIHDWLIGSAMARQFIEKHVPKHITGGKKLSLFQK